jgi:hypothetical protein
MPRDYDATTAWRLRQFWTAEIQGWAAQGVKRIRLHDGKTRDALRITAALLGLLDHMRPDGALAGGRDWWSLYQLAGFMGMSRPVAMHTLGWLQHRGLVEVKPRQSSDGRESYERWLRLPWAQVKGRSSEVDLGPSKETGGPKSRKRGSPSKEIPGAQVNVSSSQLYQSVERRSLETVEGTAAKAAGTKHGGSTVRGGDPERLGEGIAFREFQASLNAKRPRAARRPQAKRRPHAARRGGEGLPL